MNVGNDIKLDGLLQTMERDITLKVVIEEAQSHDAAISDFDPVPRGDGSVGVPTALIPPLRSTSVSIKGKKYFAI